VKGQEGVTEATSGPNHGGHEGGRGGGGLDLSLKLWVWHCAQEPYFLKYF
jgi:hypothetical protein